MNELNVALVHDHLMKYGGAERVLSALHGLFPKAPIYTLYADEKIVREYFPNATIHTTFLQSFPAMYRRRFRYVAPLAISAIEGIDLSSYNLVISSSSFFAKGVITRPDALHISYCHTPSRALWKAGEGPDPSLISGLFGGGIAIHLLRLWDAQAASRVDRFVANSHAVRGRIGKYYRKGAAIIYPPVEPNNAISGTRTSPLNKRLLLSSLPQDFFLIVSQLHEHKRIDVAVDAFAKLKYPLVIVGDGPQREELQERAGANTVFLGHQPDDIVQECYQRCRAYVHPGEEDFGMAAVEAMFAGKPVLAYRRGGVCESVIEGETGEFFDALHPAVLADGVRRMNERFSSYDPNHIRHAASRFGKERFAKEFREFLREELIRHMARLKVQATREMV